MFYLLIFLCIFCITFKIKEKCSPSIWMLMVFLWRFNFQIKANDVENFRKILPAKEWKFPQWGGNCATFNGF